MSRFRALLGLLNIGKALLREALGFLLGPKASLAAEVLFLRKQLAFYQERKIKARRYDAARISLLLLAQLFAWKKVLLNVKPATFIGWHRKSFRLFGAGSHVAGGHGCRKTFGD